MVENILCICRISYYCLRGFPSFTTSSICFLSSLTRKFRGGGGGVQTLYLLKFPTILLWFATLKHFDVIFVMVSIMPHLYSPKGEEVFLNWLAACVLLTSSASYNSVHGPDYFLFCTICGKTKKSKNAKKIKKAIHRPRSVWEHTILPFWYEAPSW